MIRDYIKTHIPTGEIQLPKAKVWHMDGDLRGEIIECLSGTIWITQTNDLQDYVLEAGARFVVSKPGTVVVQALADARLKCSRHAHQPARQGHLAQS